jgi:hypothetical protein
VNYRLKDLQKALKADTLPSLTELANSTPLDMHGPSAMMFYAYSRYVLLFVDKQAKLSELYAELRGAERKKHAAILAKYVDEKAFRATLPLSGIRTFREGGTRSYLSPTSTKLRPGRS